MEAIKWILSLVVGTFAAVVGLITIIGLVVFSTAVKLVGLFGMIIAFITIGIKSTVDEHSDKPK